MNLYDGATRDMLQNHILQILALVAMDAPCKMNAREIRRENFKSQGAATRMSANVIFGQYDGYRSEEGVDPHSGTPTYFAGTLFVDNWRWEGVPFNVTTGKKLPYGCAEVVIKLKEPLLKLYDGEVNDRIVIHFVKMVLILISVWILSMQISMTTWSWQHSTHAYPQDRQ